MRAKEDVLPELLRSQEKLTGYIQSQWPWSAAMATVSCTKLCMPRLNAARPGRVLVEWKLPGPVHRVPRADFVNHECLFEHAALPLLEI